MKKVYRVKSGMREIQTDRAQPANSSPVHGSAAKWYWRLAFNRLAEIGFLTAIKPKRRLAYAGAQYFDVDASIFRCSESGWRRLP
jgi:hypothetical protein